MKSIFKGAVATILRWEATLVLRRYKPRIVAITGSVGKTSTKDAVYTVLSSFAGVRRSEKSFNSDIGLPLTILGKPNAWMNPILWIQNFLSGLLLILVRHSYPEWLVLEVGADHPGDIAKTAEWISADVVILTRLPDVPVHVEFFSTPEEVRKEKLELLKALKPDGLIVLNGDDEYLIGARGQMVMQHSVMSCGFSEGVDVRAGNEEIFYENGKPEGVKFDVSHKEEKVSIMLHRALGKQHVYPVLFACAVGISEGQNLSDLAEAISDHQSPPGRMKILEGIKETTIIDDTYNSSPVAAHEALATLKQISTQGKKIAALGDMLELGSFTNEEHRKLGAVVVGVADMLITVGVRAKYIAEAARASGMPSEKIFEFNDSQKAGKELEHLLNPGDVVLAKGSQSIRMEKLVEEIMQEPLKKEELLVRQDEEWQKR